MSFDWNDYSADSDTEDVSLLLSTRSQSLILAAMNALDFRSSWVEVDDATWDDIHAAIGEAYEEIMEIVMSGTLGGAMMHSDSNQNMGSPTATWHKINFQVADYDTGSYIQDNQSFAAPEDGLYQIGFQAVWAANTNTDAQRRSVRFVRDDGITEKPISLDNELILGQELTPQMTMLRFLDAGDIIRVEAFTNVVNLNLSYLSGQSAYFWIERLR